MADNALLGRGLHKGKTINVEANILDEWQAERQLAHSRIRARIITLAGCFTAGLLFVPLAKGLADHSVSEARQAESTRAVLEKKLSILELNDKQIQPVISYDLMVKRERQNADSMLGNLILIFNSAPEKVAISKLKAAITGGEVTIELAADSEDPESARTFAAEAGKGPGVLYTVLASTKKSTVLGPDGLGFDIDKKVMVGQ